MSRITVWAKNAQSAKETRRANYALPLDGNNECSAPENQCIDGDSDD